MAPKVLHHSIREELGREAITYEKFTKCNLREVNYLFMHHERKFDNSKSRRSRKLELLQITPNMRIVLI